MNIILTLFTNISLLLFQPPTLPTGGTGNPPTTGIDNVPIDNYIIIGMVFAVILLALIIKRVTSNTRKI